MKSMSIVNSYESDQSSFQSDGYQPKPKSFVYPSTPFMPNQILMTLNTEMVKEVVALIKDTCCDDNGKVIDEGNNQELISFAGKLQNNMEFSEFHRERKRRLDSH
jgi:hypothetical protein